MNLKQIAIPHTTNKLQYTTICIILCRPFYQQNRANTQQSVLMQVTHLIDENYDFVCCLPCIQNFFKKNRTVFLPCVGGRARCRPDIVSLVP